MQDLGIEPSTGEPTSALQAGALPSVRLLRKLLGRRVRLPVEARHLPVIPQIVSCGRMLSLVPSEGVAPSTIGL